MCIRDRAAGTRALAPTEAAEQTALLAAHHRSVLRRAQALAILAERGYPCLLYTSDAADERSSVDLGGRRIIKKKKHEM